MVSLGRVRGSDHYVDAWLEEVFGDASKVILKSNQLVALNLAVQRGAVSPDEVMQI